jgi:hypothetical protein
MCCIQYNQGESRFTYLPWSFDLDEVKIMTKMSSLMKLWIKDSRLCDYEYSLWEKIYIDVLKGRH